MGKNKGDDKADRRCFCQYDELIGWAGRPYAHGIMDHHWENFKFEVKNNSWGLRNLREPQSNQKAIVIIGDSIAWGYGVNDAQTISEKLGMLVPDQIITLAQSGYGADQQFLSLIKYQQRFRDEGIEIKNIIMITYSGNDSQEILCKMTYGFSKPFLSLKPGEGFTNLPVPKEIFDENTTDCLAVRGKEKVRLKSEQYGKILKMLEKKSSEFGARLIVLVMPFKKTQEHILEVLQRLGISTIYDPKLGEKKYLIDGIHLNEEGNILAARMLAANLAKNS